MSIENTNLQSHSRSSTSYNHRLLSGTALQLVQASSSAARPQSRVQTSPRYLTMRARQENERMLATAIQSNSHFMDLSLKASQSLGGRIKELFGTQSQVEKAQHTIQTLAQHLCTRSASELQAATVITIESALLGNLPTGLTERKKIAIRRDIQFGLTRSQELAAQKTAVEQTIQDQIKPYIVAKILDYTNLGFTDLSILKRKILTAAQLDFSQHQIHTTSPGVFQKKITEALQKLNVHEFQLIIKYTNEKPYLIAKLEQDIQILFQKAVQNQTQLHTEITNPLIQNTVHKILVSIREKLKDSPVCRFEPTLFSKKLNKIVNCKSLEQQTSRHKEQTLKQIQHKIQKYWQENQTYLLKQALEQGTQQTITTLQDSLENKFLNSDAPLFENQIKKMISEALTKINLERHVLQHHKKNEILALKKMLSKLTAQHSTQVLQDTQSKLKQSLQLLNSLFKKNIDYNNFTLLSLAECEALTQQHLKKINIPSLTAIATNLEPTVRLINFAHNIGSQSMIASFSKGYTSDQIIAAAQTAIYEYFDHNKIIVQNLFKTLNPIVLKNGLRQACNTLHKNIEFLSQEKNAGYLKFNKKFTSNRSLVRTPTGTFELLNRFREPDFSAVKDQTQVQQKLHAIKSQRTNPNPNGPKMLLGKGSFGIARFARNIDTQEICAVKKIADSRINQSLLSIFKREQQGAQLVPASPVLVQTIGSTLVNISQTSVKGYIFMQYAGVGTGNDFAAYVKSQHKVIEHLKRTNPTEANKNSIELQRQLHNLALSATQGLAAMHQHGIFHRDVKPSNIFGNIASGFKLGDYGLATNQAQCLENAGTHTFKPPEMQKERTLHSNEKHDAFSLGISLLGVSRGLELEKSFIEPQLLLNNTPVPVQRQEASGPIVTYSGLPKSFNTTQIAGITLDEVIAKLIHSDPDQRTTPRQALKLPYFNEFNLI